MSKKKLVELRDQMLDESSFLNDLAYKENLRYEDSESPGPLCPGAFHKEEIASTVWRYANRLTEAAGLPEPAKD